MANYKYGFNKSFCCGCFEIKRGAKLLGIMQGVQLAIFVWWMFGIFTMWATFTDFTFATFPLVWLACHTILVLPSIIGMWHYYYFLTSRDPISRKPLPRAHLLNIVTITNLFITHLVGGLIINKNTPLPLGGIQRYDNMVLNWVLDIIFWLVIVGANMYWIGVTKKFSGSEIW